MEVPGKLGLCFAQRAENAAAGEPAARGRPALPTCEKRPVVGLPAVFVLVCFGVQTRRLAVLPMSL